MSHGSAAARDIALGRRGVGYRRLIACPHCGSTNTKERAG